VRESESLLAEQFEVAVPGNTGCSQVVLDDEHRDGAVLGNHDRPDHARFGEYQVIALYTDASETISLKDFYELLIRDGAKL
jgi:hypothetical protein